MVVIRSVQPEEIHRAGVAFFCIAITTSESGHALTWRHRGE